MPANKDKTPQTELVPIENGQPSVEQMIMHAIDRFGPEGAEAGVAVFEKLIALKRDQERWEAQKEFNAELSAFQADCPSIKKNSTAEVTTKAGGKYSYKYAKLDEIERTVKPILIHRGFSYSWDSRLVDSKTIEMTCHLRHKNGHEITASATSIIPDSIATMNAVQIPASVRTYLERGTLIQILGLTTADEDTDGLNGNGNGDKLTAEQVETVKKAMNDAMPPSAQERLLKFLKVSTVEEIPQGDLDNVTKLIARKKKQFEGVE